MAKVVIGYRQMASGDYRIMMIAPDGEEYVAGPALSLDEMQVVEKWLRMGGTEHIIANAVLMALEHAAGKESE